MAWARDQFFKIDAFPGKIFIITRFEWSGVTVYEYLGPDVHDGHLLTGRVDGFCTMSRDQFLDCDPVEVDRSGVAI